MKRAIFLCILFATVAVTFAASPTTDIRLDQAGYLPGMPKLAMVVAKVAATDFSIRKASDGAVVFLGRLTGPVEDADSGDRVQAADFTKFTRIGTYYIEAPGVGRSWDFSIVPDVYKRVYYLAMRSHYGQRCGTAVDLGPEFPGYTYAACHLEGAYHASSGKSGPKKTTGGWHDAGDYGRYFVNSGITTGRLLWTWELFGSRVGKISLNIPESGNAVPDILDEIRWNLDGVQLLVANAISPDPRYVQTALENLHYLLGRYTFSLSWVTQVGASPYRHPHHRPSGADGIAEPWPGLLSGGPNQNRQDAPTKNLPQLPAAKVYLDQEASYASNETRINWNAPLVFILASVLPEK